MTNSLQFRNIRINTFYIAADVIITVLLWTFKNISNGSVNSSFTRLIGYSLHQWQMMSLDIMLQTSCHTSAIYFQFSVAHYQFRKGFKKLWRHGDLMEHGAEELKLYCNTKQGQIRFLSHLVQSSKLVHFYSPPSESNCYLELLVRAPQVRDGALLYRSFWKSSVVCYCELSALVVGFIKPIPKWECLQL